MAPKQIFVLGLLLLGPAFVMFMAARSEWERAKELDAEPERVTLRQLADGDVVNRQLFLLSEFTPAESFYGESTEGKATFEACWVPLFAAGEAHGGVDRVQVVAHVHDVADADQLYAMLAQRPLLVQRRSGGVSRTEQLAKLYPGVSFENAIEVSAGGGIPSLSRATQRFLWAGLWLAGSLGCLTYTFVVHLDLLGRRKPGSSLTLDSRPVDSNKLRNSEAQLIDSYAGFFLGRGFQSLGCVDSKIMGSPSRMALFLSPDGRDLLSLVLQKRHATPTLIGIAGNGTCFSLGRGPQETHIDGTKDGIPLIVHSFPEITDEQMFRAYEALKQSLPAEEEVAKIDPPSGLALIQYRMLLKAWWALLHSASHATPDPLPDRAEIFRKERGVTTFCWGSADTSTLFGNNAPSCDTLAGAGAW